MKHGTSRPGRAGWLRRSGRTALYACIALMLLHAPPVREAAALDLKAPPLSPLAEDGIHDPSGEAINTLQNPAESMKDFPKDRRGEVNWVQALDQGLIHPRKSRTDDPWENVLMQSMDMNILMKATADMPYVLFLHRQHTEWLACGNCHPDIFIPQKDANPITMTKILNGQFCGRCHDKVSFALWTCERCHSVPHGTVGKWW
jgi:c(7)-type cytochrome triheme protein